MDEPQALTYECPLCRFSRPWRAESAGRPVDCQCGQALTVPFGPGNAGKRDLLTEIRARPAIADSGGEGVEIILCPDCGSIIPGGLPYCPQCGYRRVNPRRRIFRRRAAAMVNLARNAIHHHNHPTQPVERSQHPVRDLALPIMLAVAGFVIQVALLAHAFSPPHNWADAIAVAPLLLLLATGTIAIVFLIALIISPLLDLSLGPIVPLVIKLSAAVVFPAGVGSLMYGLCGNGVSGIAVGWLAAVILYLSLFRVLFDFDWPDALLLIALVCLAHTVTLLLVLWPLTHGALPMRELWVVFAPMIAQSAMTFCLAGGMVAPHFKAGN